MSSTEKVMFFSEDLGNLEDFPPLGASKKGIAKNGKTKTPAFFKANHSPTPSVPISTGTEQGDRPLPEDHLPVVREVGKLLGGMESSTVSGVGDSTVHPAHGNIIARSFKNLSGSNVCFANSVANIIINSPAIHLCKESGLQGHLKYFAHQDIVHDVYPLLLDIDAQYPSNTFSNRMQHDPREMLQTIMQSIDSNDSLSSLQLEYIETTRCITCNDMRVEPSSGYVYLMKSAYFSPNVQNTVNNCLKGITDEFCSTCNRPQTKEYNTIVTNAPDTLFLCALRYGFSAQSRISTGGAYKMKNMIFPTEVIEFADVSYKLQSIIIHVGETVNSGHYYTLLCDSSDPSVFHKLNDMEMSTIPRKDHKDDGYIFTYSRCEKTSLLPPPASTYVSNVAISHSVTVSHEERTKDNKDCLPTERDISSSGTKRKNVPNSPELASVLSPISLTPASTTNMNIEVKDKMYSSGSHTPSSISNRLSLSKKKKVTEANMMSINVGTKPHCVDEEKIKDEFYSSGSSTSSFKLNRLSLSKRKAKPCLKMLETCIDTRNDSNTNDDSKEYLTKNEVADIIEKRPASTNIQDIYTKERNKFNIKCLENNNPLIENIVLNADLKDIIYDSQLSGKNASTPSTPLSRLSISKNGKNIQKNNCTTRTLKSNVDICTNTECYENINKCLETTESLITKIELNDDFKDNICDSQLFDKPLSTPSTPLSRLSISKKRKNITNNCTSLTPKSDADVCKDIECFEKKNTIGTSTVLNVHLKDSVYDSQMSGDNGIIPTTPLSQLACSDPNKGIQSINTSTNKYIEDQHSLPDISIDNHSNSTTTSILNPVAPPLLGKKKKPMTAKERKQLQRARQSEATRLQELEKDRERKALSRANETLEETTQRLQLQQQRTESARLQETPEETTQRRQLDQHRKKSARLEETPEETSKRRQTEAQRNAVSVSNETPEETTQRRHFNRQRMESARLEETPEETLKRRQTDAQRHAVSVSNETPEEASQRRHFNRQRMVSTRHDALLQRQIEKKATNTHAILEGNVFVPELSESKDTLGNMDIICQYCQAVKFKKETSGLCCNAGKINLPLFPPPPEELLSLWMECTPEAKLFKDNCRALNNAVSLASMRITEKRFPGGYAPSIVIEGKVVQMMGPLLAEPGTSPAFAQLYVLDPALERTQRFANLYLPSNMTQEKKEKMRELLDICQQVIHSRNPFVRDFKQILEIPEDNLEGAKVVICASARPQHGHERVYNAQINLQELSIVTNEKPHDLVIHKRGGRLQFVSDLNPHAMPLHFTLLFVDGTLGWHKELTHSDGPKRTTTREFYAFHMQIRNIASDYLLQAKRLYQEWILLGFIAVENQRLDFYRRNQNTLRADSYKNVCDIIAQRAREENPREDSMYHNEVENSIGRMILPSSHTGGPRYFNAKFQDAMALVRKYHKPDLFITMTCNPNWPEIQKNLAPGQTPQDRPDLVARVFKLRKDMLINDLVKDCIFGKVVAILYVIEWQKRGLPHIHILIILADPDRPRTTDIVDSLVVAELPPSPFENGISELEQQKRKPLFDSVVTNMLHGPCGSINPNSPCMEQGKCKHRYPKSLLDKTIMDHETSHPVYRRRSPQDGGVTAYIRGHWVDNSWVVPYNPYLSLRYQCHVNIEVCQSPTAAKYLYKYVTKGPDRAMVAVDLGRSRDEIQNYQDMRSIGSGEAAHRLYDFKIAENKPPVMRLRIHLENEQHITFVGGHEEQAIEGDRETELTAYFRYNQKEKDKQGESFDPALLPLYIEMPEHCVFKNKNWKIRERGTSTGRVDTVNPLHGDVFYFRMLLHHDHCRGKTSFTDMKTIDGKVYETYQEVCQTLGLLSDDNEWAEVLTDAAVTKVCPQIRALYVVILMFCSPSNGAKLFEDFWEDWTDDFIYKGQQRGLVFTEASLKTMVRLDIQMRLESYEKDLEDFHLPPMTDEERESVTGLVNTEEALLRDEMDYDFGAIQANVVDVIPKFTPDQKVIFDVVMDAVAENKALQIFISARGGCGKTFLLNAILDAVRTSEPGGCIALGMATTGIAAQLLHLGRTYHSRLKAPLNPDENSTLNIAAQTTRAKLVRRAKLLLIDESTMLHRFQLEALDRTLRDLMTAPDKPFGGKIIILAGDYRQCLPVVPGANRAHIVDICLPNSHLWQNFKIYSLSENMRVKASGNILLEEFDQWTVSVGDGTANNHMDMVDIPEEMFYKIDPNTKTDTKVEERAMKHFCKQIYSDLHENVSNPSWLCGRAILAPTNKEVDTINDLMEGWIPGQVQHLSSSDQLEEYDHVMRYNIEYINTLCPSGFPRHFLSLKPGMPLMLLRNLSPKEGLCNGTKLIFIRFLNNKLLLCKLTSTGKEVFIPRIRFVSDDGEFPFHWSRRQFPVRVAFATTINKSQGQSLNRVGVWLRVPVFTHGQLYVASSRTGRPDGLTFAISRLDTCADKQTVNPIFREILLDPVTN